MSGRHALAVLLGLALLLATAPRLAAIPVAVQVNGVAADAVYLVAGTAGGLAVGMRGELRAADGRVAQLEVVFVSSGRASCRVSPAGAELRVGDEIWFDLTPPVGADTLSPRAATRELPPAAVAAITRAAAARGPRLQGWWRLDGVWDQDEVESLIRSRQAVGLRAGLARWPDLQMSVQARRRSAWGGEGGREAWLDELALSGSREGSLAWTAGRLADGRDALAGPLDGLAVERTGKGTLVWGISGGSRPADAARDGRRALGAGGRLRWQGKGSPLESDLKVRVERSSDDLAAAGLSWGNQLRWRDRWRAEQWLRAEYSEANDWRRAVARFATTRLRWQGEDWVAEGRHQVNRWPAVIHEDFQPGPALTDRRSHQVDLALSRRWGGRWAQLQARGRGERLDGDLERMAELAYTHARPGRLPGRAGVTLQALLGPRDRGQDVDLRLAATPARLPELELGLRGWRLERDLERWTGWNVVAYLHGRAGNAFRWEAGGLLQKDGDQWRREARLGLRGDVRLKARPRSARGD